LIHFILSGGHTFEFETISTLVLDLGVSTEMTEDEFFDGGNLANNLAALLGIDPSKIRVMNVIREDSARRRRRQISGEFEIFSPRLRFRRRAGQLTLQIEIAPDSNDENGIKKLNDIGATIAQDSTDFVRLVSHRNGTVNPRVKQL
jgi:hypothetical protein